MFGMDRVLPQSMEAELAVLGSIFRDNQCLGRTRKWIKSPRYFYRGVHRIIFEAMEALAEKRAPIDFVSVHDFLCNNGTLEKCGGDVYLAEVSAHGTPVNVEYYAKLVWQAAVKRQIVAYASELVDVTSKSQGAEAKEIVGKYVEQMREVSEMLAREEGVMNVQSTLSEFMKEIEAAKDQDGLSGIPYGWGKLDHVTGGMHPGEVITVVARLGIGKTFCELLLMKRAWETRKRSLFISMEMPTESIRRRFMAMMAGVPNMDLRLGRLAQRQMDKVVDACGNLHGTDKEAPIYIIGADLVDNVNDVDAFIDGLRPDICFVDGVYLLDDNKKGDMWTMTTRVIRKLKKVAARRGIPIVTTAQFNREAAKKGGMGSVEDVGFSDAIAQTSDVVIALAQNEDQKRNRQMVVRNLKNREGITVEFVLLWDLDLMRFEEVGESDEEEEFVF